MEPAPSLTEPHGVQVTEPAPYPAEPLAAAAVSPNMAASKSPTPSGVASAGVATGCCDQLFFGFKSFFDNETLADAELSEKKGLDAPELHNVVPLPRANLGSRSIRLRSRGTHGARTCAGALLTRVTVTAIHERVTYTWC